MDESIKFTFAFLKSHPEEASMVLQKLPTDVTAALLDETPMEIGIEIVERLSPQYAAQCFMSFKSETTLELLQKVKVMTAASSLRLLPYSLVRPMLQKLPEDKNAVLKKRLEYPQDSVGAWMDSDCPTVPDGSTVGSARSVLRNSGKPVEHSLSVLKKDGAVAGILPLSKLAVSNNNIPISKVIITDLTFISDRAPLESIFSNFNWEMFDAIPVINRKGDYQGILTRTNLEKGLNYIRDNYFSENTDSIVLDIVKTYASTLSGLTQSLLAPPREGKPPSGKAHHE